VNAAPDRSAVQRCSSSSAIAAIVPADPQTCHFQRRCAALTPRT